MAKLLPVNRQSNFSHLLDASSIFSIQNNPNAAIEYLEKAVENDERNIFATLDLLKVYMANIPTYKNKMEKIFGNLTQKQGKKYDELLILKAVYTFLNGNSEACVNFLVQAVKVNDKCIESLEVSKIRFDFKMFSSLTINIFIAENSR